MAIDSTIPAPLSTRQQKALTLIEAGAIALVPGRKWATVKGSGKASYKVSKSGCECPDYKRLGLDAGDPGFMCKHRLCLKALCDLARIARREARETGRCRIPAPLARALAAGTRETAERARRLAEIAADDQSDLFPVQTLGQVV